MPSQRQRKQHLKRTPILYGDEEVQVVQVLERDLDKEIKPKEVHSLVEEEPIRKEKKPKVSRRSRDADEWVKTLKVEDPEEEENAIVHDYQEQETSPTELELELEEQEKEEQHEELDYINVIEEPPLASIETSDVYLKAIESLSETVRNLQAKLKESERKRREDHEAVMDVLQDLKSRFSESNGSTEEEISRSGSRRESQKVQRFPITTMEKLTKLEEQMRTDKKLRQELIQIFEEGSTKKLQSLKKWIADEVILKFNANGRHSSNRAGTLKLEDSLLIQTIRSAWVDGGFTKEDYEEILRTHWLRARARLQKSKKNKRHSYSDDEDDDED